MGYSKIDKNKIQPSPSLAFLNGILGGLNARKKEMQDREDKQNKMAVDWYKMVQEQGYKDRMAIVAEKTAQTDLEYKASLINKANEDVNTSRAVESRLKEQWLLNKTPLEAQSNPNHPFNIAQRKIKEADLWSQALNDIKKQEKLDELKYGKDYVNTGSYRREQEIQLEFKRKEIEAQNVEKYTPSIQTNKGLRSPAQVQQDIETTGQLLVEGERAKTQKAVAGMNITGRKDVAGMEIAGRESLAQLKGETESADPKVKNFISIQKANQGFFGSVITSPNKILDDLSAGYITERSKAEMDAWNQLTLEQQKGLTAPTAVGVVKAGKEGWKVLGWQTKIGSKPPEILTGIDMENFRLATTSSARQDMLRDYNKQDARNYLLDRGVSDKAAKYIVDEVYKKK